VRHESSFTNDGPVTFYVWTNLFLICHLLKRVVNEFDYPQALDLGQCVIGILGIEFLMTD